MSVRVKIDIDSESIDIEKSTHNDSPAARFRAASYVLEEIAADIRRMYPDIETVQERGWGAPREDLDTRPLPAWYRTDTPHSEHPHTARDSHCMPDKSPEAEDSE